MMMMPNDLPLLELFSQLREAGLPLGVDEYRLVLRAMQAGFGISDRTALSRLCRTIWVKSAEEERLFDHYFDKAISQLSPSETISSSHKSLPPKIESEPESTISPPSPALTPTKASATTPSSIPTPSEITLKIEDEIQAARSVLHGASNDDIPSYDRYIGLDEYFFPVTRRQMKQIWRYLRRPIREGPPVEVDIEATVNKVGREAILLEPVLVPPRVNRVELVLLIDQAGSMVPFHSLSQRLTETALRGGCLGATSIYYFHNCPIGYLYRDPNHLQHEPLQSALSQLHPKGTAILIFSDAGAARGSLNLTRVETTEAFLYKLKSKVHHIAWLNPMPRYRWIGTTANEIANFIPMFEMSRRGLDDAIDILRGRYASFLNQRD